MRRVNIITGIKQRLGEILGNGTSSDLTSWSIQTAMMSNLTALTKAMAGDNPYGRVLSGMNLSHVSGLTFRITPGFAISPSGGLISLQATLDFNIGSLDGTPYYIFAKYNVIQLTSGSQPGYKSTAVIGQNGSQNIVYDEVGKANGTSVSASDILMVDTFPPGGGGSSSPYAHVGTITMAAGVPTITESVYRGFLPGTSEKAIATRSTELELPDSADTTVVFNNLLKGSGYSTSTGQYYAQSAGFRQVSWKLTLLDDPGWTVQEFFKTYISMKGAAAGDYCFEGTYRGFANNAEGVIERESIGSALVYMEANDWFVIKALNTSGSTQRIKSAIPNGNFLTIATLP